MKGLEKYSTTPFLERTHSGPLNNSTHNPKTMAKTTNQYHILSHQNKNKNIMICLLMRWETHEIANRQ
jgi:hypothetical protein